MKLLTNSSNIDLHIHSNFSDGRMDLRAIINLCLDLVPITISITDHDNMSIYKLLDREELKERGIDLIPGVEMTCLYNNELVHVLGYNINPNLFTLLKKVYYKKYRGHYYKHITFKNATKLIHLLGGKVVLAHPYKYGRNIHKGEYLVQKVIEDKLIDGIECFHTYHTQEETEILLGYAAKYDLYVTAGSDFHYLDKVIRGNAKSDGIGRLDVMNENIVQVIERYKNAQRINK